MFESLNPSPRLRVWFSITLLALAALCFAVAPMLMPASYSVVENAISESAAQGVEGAWLARTGFLLFGFGVLRLAGLAEHWGPWGRAAFGLFGVAMIGAATFSHMPWEAVPFVELEDRLHSVAASVVGLSFTVGVLLVLFQRTRGDIAGRVFDLAAIAIAPTISMIMFNVDGIAGLVQRIMFGVAFMWFGTEAVRVMRRSAAVDASPLPELDHQPAGVEGSLRRQ